MNNVTPKNLEFIQITRSSRGRAKSMRPRRQVKKDRRHSCRYVENVFGRQRWNRTLQPTVVKWSIWIGSICKNEPNVKFYIFDSNRYMTDIYKKWHRRLTFGNPENKPKTNPILPQKSKTNAFSRKWSFTIVIIILHAKLITLKGVNICFSAKNLITLCKECITKLIVAPKTSVFVSGKEGEAGNVQHCRWSLTPPRDETSRLNAESFC